MQPMSCWMANFQMYEGFAFQFLVRDCIFPTLTELQDLLVNHIYLQILHIRWQCKLFLLVKCTHDSLFKQQLTFYTLKQIAAIQRSSESRLHFQKNSTDCGAYAIAFITNLCHGIDPGCLASIFLLQAAQTILGLVLWKWTYEALPFNTINKEKALESDSYIYMTCLISCLC